MIPYDLMTLRNFYESSIPGLTLQSSRDAKCHEIRPISQITQYTLYNDVTMSVMASQITGIWTFVHPFIQTHIKEIIKAPRHWPLWYGNPPLTDSPHKRASNAENVSIWWRHHVSSQKYGRKRHCNLWSYDICIPSNDQNRILCLCKGW